ncbi:MAG: AsmA-like C-terminal region-containing protein, partial [Pseudomonadota bacterium]
VFVDGAVTGRAPNLSEALAQLEIELPQQFQNQAFALAGDVSYRGDRATLNGMNLSLGNLRVGGDARLTLADETRFAADLRMSADGSRLDLDVSGQQGGSGAIQAALSASSPNARAVLAALGVSLDTLPANVVERLDLNVTVSQNAKVTEIRDLKLGLDAMKINGSGRYDTRGARPTASLVLSVDRVDVAKYSPKAASGGGGGAITLPDMDIEASLQVGEMIVEGRRIRDLSLNAGTNGKVLAVSKFNVGDGLGWQISSSGKVTDLASASPTVDFQGIARTPDLARAIALARPPGENQQASAKGAPGRVNISVRGPLDRLSFETAVTSTNGRSAAAIRFTPGASSAFTAKVTTKTDEIAKYLGDFGIADIGAPGAIDMRIDAVGTPERLTLSNISGRMGPADLKGNAVVDLTRTVPRVTGEVQTGELAFAADQPAPSAPQQSAGPPWTTDPIDLSGLAAVDLDLQMRARAISFGAYRFSEPSVRLVSRGETLEFRNLSGRLFGGEALMNLEVAGGGVPRLALGLKVSNASLEEAAFAALNTRPATGTVSIAVNLTGEGRSSLAMARSLAGTASLASRNGVLKNIDLPRINRQIGDLSTINEFLRITGAALTGGQTAYRTISADFRISKGQMTTEQFLADVDGAALDLNTQVDFPGWRMQAVGAAQLARLAQAPPIGLRVTGPIDATEISYDTKPLQNYVLARAGGAILRGVTKGEGVGLKDLIFGGQPGQQPDPNAGQDGTNPSNAAPNQRPDAMAPEQVIDGLFGIISGAAKRKREREEREQRDGKP